CYNYFPIVLVKGELQISGGYGQGVVIMDRFWTGTYGSEFELESSTVGTVFAGIIIGFGCPEIQNQHQFFGAVYADKYTQNQTCLPDASLRMDKYATAQWSTCVVETVLQRTGLAAASGGLPAPGGLIRVTRGFGTSLR
ncbi:MAG: hypothetical protein ACREMV_15905, partial [Gemmatimonadales bacterium]